MQLGCVLAGAALLAGMLVHGGNIGELKSQMLRTFLL
jgi:hypothetical protein